MSSTVIRIAPLILVVEESYEPVLRASIMVTGRFFAIISFNSSTLMRATSTGFEAGLVSGFPSCGLFFASVLAEATQPRIAAKIRKATQFLKLILNLLLETTTAATKRQLRRQSPQGQLDAISYSRVLYLPAAFRIRHQEFS